jgi:hypothetical protein
MKKAQQKAAALLSVRTNFGARNPGHKIYASKPSPLTGDYPQWRVSSPPVALSKQVSLFATLRMAWEVRFVRPAQ